MRAEHLALELAEPGTQATVKVQLTDAPAGTVTVPLSSSDPGEGTVQPAELVFTAENWSVPQVVTVRAADDAEADGVQAWTVVVGPMRSTDDRWNGFDPPDLAVTTWDDERGALVVTALEGVLGEWGSSASFTVALSAAPAADVTVAVSPLDASEGSVSSSQLVFTTADWSTPKRVAVRGVDDFALDGTVAWQVRVGPTDSVDPAWRGLEATVDAATGDDDRPAFRVQGLTGAVSETGAQATFQVVLESEPSADVLVTVTSSDPSQATVAPASLVFGPGDWRTPRQVTVSGVDNDRVDGERRFNVVVGPLESTEAGWAGLAPVVLPLVVSDDDKSGYVISAVTGAITEAGGQATFTVQLEGPPEGDVTLSVRTGDASEATVAPAQLVFTTANWQAPQTVTFTGVDDAIDDGDVLVSAVFGPVSSTDPTYAVISVPRPVGAPNRDDDTAGLAVSALTGTLTEAGSAATLTVRLNSEPTANVTLPVRSSDGTEATVSPASLLFTAANWQTPQTVTVSGVDDLEDDGDQQVRVVLGPVSSSDATYAGRVPSGPAATVADDDVAGITVSSLTGQPTEAGGTATFTVRLDSQPAANVTMALGSSDPSEGSVSPSTITFSTANWNVARTVTITGLDDTLDDGDVGFVVRFSPAVSTDLNYAGRDPDDVSVTTADNDEAGVVASAVTGQATEAGARASFTLKLRTQPAASVTFALSTSDAAQASVGPASLTFTSANWNTAQTVTVSAVDDAVDDGDVVVSVVLAPAVSTDAAYDGLQVSAVAVPTIDDDTRGLVLAPPTGSPSEAGGAVVYLIQLQTPPTADVTFPLSSSDDTEGAVSPASVTFTPTDWHTAQQVTVTGVDDEIDDDATSFSLRIGAASSQDAAYAGFDPADPVVRTSDDDTAGIIVDAVGPLETTESGGTSSFTVKLATEPVADVVMALSTDDGTEATVAPVTLTFTASDWRTPKTVVVQGVDDGLDDGDQPFTLVIPAPTTTDAVYAAINPADLAGSNVDDDTAGIHVSAVTGAPGENGAAATFAVSLQSQPSASVTIAVSSDDATEATVSAASVTFTTNNWNQAQVVTVTGVDDDAVDGDVAFEVRLGAAVSSDAQYAGLDPADLSLANVDDDEARLVVSALTGAATEAGGAATFSVRLAAQPTADVTIAISSSDGSEGTVSPGSITFDASTWSTPQVITVTGEDDAVDDGAVPFQVVLGAAASLDPTWAGVDAPDVSVSTADDDAAGISVSAASAATLAEAGGSATFTVVLASQPTADVTIAVSTDDASEGTPDVASLVFTAANWSQAQTITVNAVADAVDDGDQSFAVVLGAAVSGDGSYAGLNPADRSFTTVDDDQAGISVSALSGPLAEAAGSATFVVRLDSQPTANVVIALASSDATEGAPAAASLTFTAADWSQAQTVTVNAVNDAVDDGDVDFTIELAPATSDDARYAGLDADDVSARTVDDDTLGVNVSAISNAVSEAGATATFIVRLEAQPTADVIIPVASSDVGEGTVAVTNLTFTTANWQTAQTVTVTGVDDPEDDGDVTFAIELGVLTSSDGSWAGLDPENVSVTNTDDDTVGIVATPTTGLVTTESGGTATFTVQLATRPSFDVSVSVVSTRTDEGTVSPSSLTFTAANWSTPRTVTITGAQDFALDSNVAYAINLVSTSTDPKYHGRAGPSVGVTNTNDDFSCDPVAATTTWSSGTYRYATIDCGLRDASTLGRTAGWWKVPAGWGLAPNDADAQLAAASFPWATDVLVFADGAGWATARASQPGASGSNLLLTDTGGGYTVGAIDARVFIRQLDPAALVVSPASGLETTEGGGTATFTVRLATQPWSNVTVSVGSGDSTEGTASPATLTFTTANWSTTQTVTVTGASDLELDSDIPFVVGLSSASGDPSYQGRTATVSATNRNDDFMCNPSSPEVFILQGGYRYASIDCVTTTSTTAGTMTGFYRALPGWEIAPDDAEGRAAVDARPWGAEFMYIGAGILRTTSLHATPGVNLSNSWPTTQGPGLKFPGLNARVLVRQQDPEGFVVSPTTGLVTRENGGTATFTVKLAQAPQADVTVPLTSSDPSEGSVSPATLTFTSANWNVAQTVTLSGVDDTDADGQVAYGITVGAASSADPSFNGRVGATVSVTNHTDECDPLASPATSVSLLGMRYATLDCAEVDSAIVGCQQGFWRVPSGWELAPEEPESELVAMDHRWSTHVVVLSGGAGWRTRLGELYDGQTGQHSTGDLTMDGQGGYGVIGCELRVLIRQPEP